VVREKMLVHVRTYHPDYLAWSKPYRTVALGLVAVGVSVALAGVFLKNLLLLPLALVIPLAVALPVLIVYRRKFAAFKETWTQEHPIGLATVQPSPSLFKCEICGKEIAVEKGIQYDMRDHYKSEHPDYYRWQQRDAAILVLVAVAVAALIIVLPFTGFSNSEVLLIVLGTLIIILSLALFYVVTGIRRFRRAWQRRHPL
jgi:hypothetical protein